MKMKELREMSVEQLKAKEVELRKQLFDLLAQFIKTAAAQYGTLARGTIAPVKNLASDLRDEAKPVIDKLSAVRALATTILNKLEELPSSGSSGEKK